MSVSKVYCVCMNYWRHVSYILNAAGDSLSITSSSYRNSSNVVGTTLLPTSKLAEFSCISSGSPPTNITWLRNGQRVNEEHGFHTGVRVLDRYSYIFNNTLSVYNVTGAVGRNIYTCIIKKIKSEHSILSTQVYTLRIYISYSCNIIIIILISCCTESVLITSSPVTFHGERLVLTCRVKYLPGVYRATTLLHWTVPVNESITIGEQYSCTDYIERKLEFDYLTSSHDGRYECQITNTSMIVS